MKWFYKGGETLTPLCVFLISACTVQSSTSNHYLTAEKLWTEKNYPAAVSEFDRVVKEAPNSAIGLQALWRSSMTKALFLNAPEDALKGFELFLERASNSELAPQAQMEIGELYFSKLGQFQKAIEFYTKLLPSKRFQPQDIANFKYRIARSYFQTNRIKKSIEWYESVLTEYPDSPVAMKVMFDLAGACYAMGENDKQAYNKALKIYQDLKQKSQVKNHRMYVEAIFGEAATREELDQLEEAYDLFQSIKADYPAPNVIQVRMVRLNERMKKKRK